MTETRQERLPEEPRDSSFFEKPEQPEGGQRQMGPAPRPGEHAPDAEALRSKILDIHAAPLPGANEGLLGIEAIQADEKKVRALKELNRAGRDKGMDPHAGKGVEEHMVNLFKARKNLEKQ